MAWEVKVSDEFIRGYDGLDESESDSVDVAVGLLEEYGPLLGRQHADVIRQWRFPTRRNCGFSTKDARIASAVPKAGEIYAKHLAQVGYSPSGRESME